MLMERTGIYFLLLFLVFLIVYITVKISLAFLLKRAREKSVAAYIPIYTTYYLVDLLDLKKKVFFMSLIPFVNLYYYYIIIGKLLEAFGQNPKEAIWFIVFPMYKFPELAFKKPKYSNNEYELTKGFLEAQSILFEAPKEELPDQINLVNPISMEDTPVDTVIDPVNYDQVQPVQDIPNVPSEPSDNTWAEDSVFTNTSLEPDKSHVTYVEAKPEEEKEEKPIITPLNEGRPQMCPNCGAKLAPGATTCFLCGHKLN